LPPGNFGDGSSGIIDPKYYSALALYFLKYIKEYEKHGVKIDYLSLFNEPVDSYTNISVAENIVLLKKFVGPLIRKYSPDTKLTFAEHC